MDGTPLKKMSASLDPEGRVDYSIFIKDGLLPLHDRIGSSFTLRFTGIRTCMSCGKHVKKFYGQGTCFPCLKSAPEASPCIIRPELCEAHLGLGRDVEGQFGATGIGWQAVELAGGGLESRLALLRCGQAQAVELDAQ